jgi:phosphate-selective porin OprO/OprP
MHARRWAAAVAAVCLATGVAATRVGAEEQRVVDQLLEILRANKQITDQQYRDLKRRAEEERQDDMRKRVIESAPSPPATATVAVAAAPAPTPPTPSSDTMRPYFKNGFNLDTADGNFKLNIGGRMQLDENVSTMDQDVKEAFNQHGTFTGVELRRARLHIAGVVYGNIDFKFEYDFATGSAAAKDVYAGTSQLPIVQYVRVGHYKEPFSLEESTSDDFTTFMERGLPNALVQNSFQLDRNDGIAMMPNFFDERMTFGTGGFRETNNNAFGFGNRSNYDVPARLTGLPLYENDGEDLIHLGFSYMHRFRENQQQAFQSRPESHLFPVNLANTGNMTTKDIDLINPEFAVVRGPFSFQSEAIFAFVNDAQIAMPPPGTTPSPSDPNFYGFYTEASYFVTGDHRQYRPQFGYFDRIIPIHNFSLTGPGWGAWQVAARFSRLSLDSKTIHGGDLDDITAGLNWYLNPNAKITANYVWAHLASVGDSNIYQSRFQLTF